MSEFRLANNVTAHYTSFEELAKAFGCKPVNKQTNNQDKLNKQRENFCGRHLCKACKQPMVYIGGNIMCCKNESCKGIKHELKNDDGDSKVWYTPSFDLLDEKGSEIAINLFA